MDEAERLVVEGRGRAIRRGMAAGVVGGLVVGALATTAGNVLDALHANFCSFIVDAAAPLSISAFGAFVGGMVADRRNLFGPGSSE